MSARDTILVTGGASLLGSHFARMAHETGSRVIAVDDRAKDQWPTLPYGIGRIQWDGTDQDLVKKIIEDDRITAIVHFAGKHDVRASKATPASYFKHNVTRPIALLDVVREVGPRVFVYSSSAAVYGDVAKMPISEDDRYAPISPYGATKLAFEHALASYGTAYKLGWVALRCFNAAGAHRDGVLRDMHVATTSLIPLALDAAFGRGPPVDLFGYGYPTRDGTCVRDYVHVWDLAQAHLDALDALDAGRELGAINLGSGLGHTVHEVFDTVSGVIGTKVPWVVAPRLNGDPAELVADITRARQMLGWRPVRHDLGTIIEDAARARRDRNQ